MSSYRLSAHAYVCVTAEGAILLDLKGDTYIGLDRQHALAMADVVEDWPKVPGNDEPVRSGDFHSVAGDLRARGLLTDQWVGLRAPSLTVSPPARQLVSGLDLRIHGLRLRQVLAFFVAFLIAELSLCFLSLHTIVRRREHQRASCVGIFDLERGRELIRVYQRMRAWTFSRKGRCMLDTLTLLYYLSFFDLYPHWVIGVQVRPFSAHTWAQHGDWVLNGTPGFVRGYEPILVA